MTEDELEPIREARFENRLNEEDARLLRGIKTSQLVKGVFLGILIGMVLAIWWNYHPPEKSGPAIPFSED